MDDQDSLKDKLQKAYDRRIARQEKCRKLLASSGSVHEYRGEAESFVAAANTPEPAPQANSHPAVWDLVIADMQARDQFGRNKYKTRLQPHNGRNALVDAYQEVLDLAVYLRQKIYEESGK